MGLNANNVGNQKPKMFSEPLQGTYPGRLVQVIDLGLQPQRPFQGNEKAPANELYTTYELVDEFMKDEKGIELEDKPRWISERFAFHNLNSTKATSTKRYLALDPNLEYDGNWPELLGLACNVTVVNNPGTTADGKKRVYENIASTAPMRKKDADKLPALVNKPKFFDLADPDLEVFKSLPEWLQQKIKSNLNYNGSKLQNLLGEQEVKNEPVVEDGEEPEDNPY